MQILKVFHAKVLYTDEVFVSSDINSARRRVWKYLFNKIFDVIISLLQLFLNVLHLLNDWILIVEINLSLII